MKSMQPAQTARPAITERRAAVFPPASPPAAMEPIRCAVRPSAMSRASPERMESSTTEDSHENLRATGPRVLQTASHPSSSDRILDSRIEGRMSICLCPTAMRLESRRVVMQHIAGSGGVHSVRLAPAFPIVLPTGFAHAGGRLQFKQ